MISPGCDGLRRLTLHSQISLLIQLRQGLILHHRRRRDICLVKICSSRDRIRARISFITSIVSIEETLDRRLTDQVNRVLLRIAYESDFVDIVSCCWHWLVLSNGIFFVYIVHQILEATRQVICNDLHMLLRSKGRGRLDWHKLRFGNVVACVVAQVVESIVLDDVLFVGLFAWALPIRHDHLFGDTNFVCHGTLGGAFNV